MRYEIYGGNPLNGSIFLQGSKNGALPLLAAAVITRSTTIIENIPDLTDVQNFLTLARQLGANAEQSGGRVYLDASDLHAADLDPAVVKSIRASTYFLPILSTLSDCFTFPYPGGCALGPRPLNYHLKLLERFGAAAKQTEAGIEVFIRKLTPTTLELPSRSFGATVNAVLLAAVLPGVTTITNPAREPEIVNLTTFLARKGTDITWLKDTLIIRGTTSFTPLKSFSNLFDRIAASTYLLLGAAGGGMLKVKNAPIADLEDIFGFFERAEIPYEAKPTETTVYSRPLEAKLAITAEPYPGFATDNLPLLLPLFSVSKGLGIFKDRVYPHRCAYLEELKKFGANVLTLGDDIIVLGTRDVHPAKVAATDLRGAAAMLMMALLCPGHSTLSGAEILSRGYEKLLLNLKGIGAKITEHEE